MNLGFQCCNYMNAGSYRPKAKGKMNIVSYFLAKELNCR